MDQRKCEIYNNEKEVTERLEGMLEKYSRGEEGVSTDEKYLVCNGEYHYETGFNENLSIVIYQENSIECPEYRQRLKKAQKERDEREKEREEKENILRQKENILRQEKEVKTFDNYDVKFNSQEKEMKLIKSFPYNENYRKLILVGRTGIGKTHLSLALKRFIRKEGFGSELINVQELYEIFRKINFIETEREAHSDLRVLKKNCLLIIDDLGLEKQTERGVFNYGLIELIDNFRGKMIVTSNLSIEEMKGIYGEKIISRLLEKSLIIRLTGKDYRRK